MIDVELNTRLLVHPGGPAGPYLLVPIQQLADVEAARRAADIPLSVSRDAIQIDGHDAIAPVDFGRRVDPARVQSVLDQH